MEKRRRFNAERICSSDNFEMSLQAHENYLRRTGRIGESVIKTVIEQHVVRKCYMSCFGKLIEITEEEASRIESTVKIIRK